MSEPRRRPDEHRHRDHRGGRADRTRDRDGRQAEDLTSREDPYNVTQASRSYFLPNAMTAGNLFCGFMAVVSCVHARLAESALTYEYLGASPADHYRYAVWFILGAAAFDVLDGVAAIVELDVAAAAFVHDAHEPHSRERLREYQGR